MTRALLAIRRRPSAPTSTRRRRTIADGGPRQRVEADFESAIRSGANGTPTFFVNGVRYDGSWMYEPFAEYLTELLDG